MLLVGVSIVTSACDCWPVAEVLLLAAIIVGAAHGLHQIVTRRVV